MKVYIITTFLGVFGVNEKNKVVGVIPFPKDPKIMAQKYKESELEVIKEEKDLQTKLWKKGYKQFVYTINKPGVKHVETNAPQVEYLKSNLVDIAMQRGLIKKREEFNQLYLKFNLELAKVKIKLARKKDSFLIQLERAIEDIDKTLNLFSERLREWYGIHFPELNRAIDSHEKFAKIVAKYGARDKIDDSNIQKLAEESIGLDIDEEDEKALKEFAQHLVEMYKLREKLSKHLEKSLRKMMPNFTAIAGPMLAAKLLSKAGGLEKLARMPSSTIQLLGAEKALFRYLHGKGKPPKHGIIFSHPYVQKAPKEKRGKIK